MANHSTTISIDTNCITTQYHANSLIAKLTIKTTNELTRTNNQMIPNVSAFVIVIIIKI